MKKFTKKKRKKKKDEPNPHHYEDFHELLKHASGTYGENNKNNEDFKDKSKE